MKTMVLKRSSKTKSSKENMLIFIAKSIIYFGLFYLFSKAKVMGRLSPCFYGMFLGVCFAGENAFCILPSYFFASILVDSSASSLIFSLLCGLVGGVVAHIFKHKGKQVPMSFSTVTSVILGLMYIYLKSSSWADAYYCFIDIMLNTLFMFCALNFVKVVSARRLNLNLNVDELVCGCLVLALAFCALQNINYFKFDIVKFIGFELILFATAIAPNSFAVVMSIVMGLGCFLTAGQLEYTTLFCIVSVFSYIFKKQNKVFSVVALLSVDVSLGLFLHLFGEYNIWSIMSSVLSCFIYLAVPNTLMSRWSAKLFVKKEENTLKTMLNQNKLQTSKKLLWTAEVFYEMDRNFRNMVKGSLDSKSAKQMIASELIRSNCDNCPQRSRCLKGFAGEHKKVFDSLTNSGFEKGKVGLIDFPSFLTNRCTKLNQIITGLNSLLSDYRSYAKVNQDLDSSKLLIAEQLKGISNVLTKLSKESKEMVCMDSRLEKQIVETLTYNDIVPSEVVCFEKDEKTTVVSMILRAVDFDNEKISKILTTIFPSKMVLDEVLPSEESLLTYVSYKTAPTYDMAVGIASATKGGNTISGDTHSLTKLGGEKFMLAICDGMGSGEQAHRKSETSINIIENFYKAGYDDQTILSSVNNLLNLGGDNIFSALDVSVVDLKNGEADFIKQGATVGFIKGTEGVSKIESNSLPLGVLEEVSPKVTKTVLGAEDYVVMLSDGVVDSLGEDGVVEFLRTTNAKGAQEMADNLLQCAKKAQKNYPQDDMTVLIGKLFYTYA